MKRIVSFCLILFVFLSVLSAKDNPFKIDYLSDGVLAGTSLAFNTAAILIDNETAFCPRVVYDIDNVNFFDRWAICGYNEKIDKVGDIFQYISFLTPAVLIARPIEDWPVIAMMYLEASTLVYGSKNLIKDLVDRTRPFIYKGDTPMDYTLTGDWNNSFLSGHTALSFVGATFTSYVFSKYYPDSKFKLPVIIGSYALATTTAVLRVCSGNHFISDVIAGAVLGSAIGIVVPILHVNIEPKDSSLSLSVSPFGLNAVVRL